MSHETISEATAQRYFARCDLEISRELAESGSKKQRRYEEQYQELLRGLVLCEEPITWHHILLREAFRCGYQHAKTGKVVSV